MSAPYQDNQGIADAIVQWQEILFQVIITGNAVDTLIVPQTDAPGIYAYCEIGGVQPSTAGTGLLFLQDADANFGALQSNGDPSSFGLLLLTGDAWNPGGSFIPSPVLEALRVPFGVTPSITLRGGGLDGVTTSNNLSFLVSCAGAAFDTNNTFEFLFRAIYKRNINNP